MAAANTTGMVGECSAATPADGTILECDVKPGQTLQWMAYRPRPGAAPGLLRHVRWAGPKPFRASVFRITAGSRSYTFVVPKLCGNVSLMGVREKPREVLASHVALAPAAATSSTSRSTAARRGQTPAVVR